jgi:aspartate/methionine/tyrosine aminotransferase
MFSKRVAHSQTRNQISCALDARRAAGLPIIDLTLSNPTTAGFEYPPALLEPLAAREGLVYEPQPFGLAAARDAVSQEFARRGVHVPANHIVLTASTSEAYSLLFKLLCDPGEVVLAPRPSYPLVEYLTALDAVSLQQYSLEFHGRWAVDLHGLQERFNESAGRIAAVIVISPNNPTGSYVTQAEVDPIAELAREHDAALISDEVFADYPMSKRETAASSLITQQTALSFVLGGLSKSIGLPQAKLGWIAVGGPPAIVCEALERLETICDAYLSVSTPVQLAAPHLLMKGAALRAQIQKRVRENYAALKAVAVKHAACSVLPVEGGWYAICEVPAIKSEEAIVLDLLDATGVLVHPGYFFDFEREAYLVISLLPDPVQFSSAVTALFGEVGRCQ